LSSASSISGTTEPPAKIALLAACLLGYWILVRWVPVPGAGMPDRDIPFLDKDMNIVAWLDRQLISTMT